MNIFWPCIVSCTSYSVLEKIKRSTTCHYPFYKLDSKNIAENSANYVDKDVKSIHDPGSFGTLTIWTYDVLIQVYWLLLCFILVGLSYEFYSIYSIYLATTPIQFLPFPGAPPLDSIRCLVENWIVPTFVGLVFLRPCRLVG